MTDEFGTESAGDGAAKRSPRSLGLRLRTRLRRYWRGLIGVYRPERHYMRGSQSYSVSNAKSKRP